ncbi:MAG: phosphoribosylformylglycinamidine cyclo-ligase [Deltaproteobacteria bacterium]|nr:phosphoribosylformylglycinamidine cyclo-ligase [Deltaproteobacteria bacterium]
MTYKSSGVDIDKGNELVDRISQMSKSNVKGANLSVPGGFAGLFSLSDQYSEPILVSSTDGVGTKLKIAFAMDKHDTIGQDLVAMSINDILVAGADPLFFLDYLATSHLEVDAAAEVIEGINRACNSCQVALLGGETAELPGFYQPGEYDLAGFAVGVVEKAKIPDPNLVKAGDLILGLPSSGLHSNGYSLARKVFFEVMEKKIDSIFPELNKSVGELLLEPTNLYVNQVKILLENNLVKTMAHITGGGLVENPPRTLPEGLGADIRMGAWPLPPVFNIISEAGVGFNEMVRTFNMGIGYIFVIAPENQEKAKRLLSKSGFSSYVVGSISEREKGKETRFIK